MPCPRHRLLLNIVLPVLLVFAEASCHKKQVPIAAPALPGPAAEAPQPTEATPAPPVPTATAPAPTQTSPPKDESQYQKNKTPDQPAPPVKRTARPSNPTPAPQAPASNNTAPPAPSPHLGDILTPDQQRQYNGAIDQSLARAQSELSSIGNRQLTKEQEATAAQVRNFILQAQETRKTDLAAAKSLAERAEVLAKDLLASLH